MSNSLKFILLLLALAVSTGCASLASIFYPFETPISVELVPLETGTCSGSFTAIDLPHEIQVSTVRVHDFDSLGTGLAANDFDNDGDIDLVMANLDGPTVILWNETRPQKKPRFRRQNLTDSATSVPTSAILAVDANADGWIDLALTHTSRPPTLWLNRSAADGLSRIFTRDPDFSAGYFAHVMDWADLDNDGDLDIVTATYDRLLAKEFGGFIPGGGVAYYENRDSGLLPRLLVSGADALAILIMDLDHDGWSEIIIGNDYERPDYVFTRTDDTAIGWKQITPLLATPTNTMSYAADDINNDGQLELFGADMKPYINDNRTRTAWIGLSDGKPPDQTQKDANVLLSIDSMGNYQDQAVEANIDATGWSWSSKFGDLDSDGNLDLYVVNGVITAQVFSHLPGDELVEKNQVRQGDGNGYFLPKPEWKLNSIRSGRGMTMADLDNDGDLDIVVSNIRSPSQVFQNQLCEGANLLVDLRQPNTSNTYAIGTRAVLVTKLGLKQTRFVRAQSGYLSGDPNRLHFGIPEGDEPEMLEITWPDGRQSTVREIISSARLVIIRQ